MVIKTTKGDFTVKKSDMLLDKCNTCEHHDQVVADHVVGDRLNVPSSPDTYDEIKKFKAMSVEEKAKFWLDQFSRCIRCYACRNTCPGCTCKQCVFDEIKPDWVGKEIKLLSAA